MSMSDSECNMGLNLFNSDNNTERFFEQLKLFRNAYEPVHAYICMFICTFGVTTNFINILVLTTRQMRTSVNVLLTGIAVCDLATMLLYLIYVVHFVILRDVCNSTYSYAWIVWLIHHSVLSVAFHTTDLWLAVAVAYVRRMTLKNVRLDSMWVQRRNAWKICSITYATVFTLCLSYVFGQRVVDVTDEYNETCSTEVSLGERFYSLSIPSCQLFQFNQLLNGIVFKMVSCVLLAVLSLNLLHMLNESKRHRLSLFLDEQQRPTTKRSIMHKTRADRTTSMLLLILLVFLVTELPQGLLAVLSGVFVDVHNHIYNNVADVLDLLSLVNSSVNFFLYCIMSSKYRQVFWKVLLPRKLYVRWYIRGAVSSSKSTGFEMDTPMNTRVMKIARAPDDNTWEYKQTCITETL